MPKSGGSLRVSQHDVAPLLSLPLPSPVIRSLSPKSLNRTQVDPAHSVVLPAHTRVVPLSYFSCPAHTLVWGPGIRSSISRYLFIGMVRWANSLGTAIDAGATVLQQFGASEIGSRADMSKGEVSSVTNGEVS